MQIGEHGVPDEVQGEEVVADVARAEHQPAGRVTAGLCGTPTDTLGEREGGEHTLVYIYIYYIYSILYNIYIYIVYCRCGTVP